MGGGEFDGLMSDPTWQYLEIGAASVFGGKAIETVTDTSIGIELFDDSIALVLRQGREHDDLVQLSGVE